MLFDIKLQQEKQSKELDQHKLPDLVYADFNCHRLPDCLERKEIQEIHIIDPVVEEEAHCQQVMESREGIR